MSERQLQIPRGILKLSIVEVGSVYHWPMTWPKTKTLTNSRLPVGKGLCWRWRARLQAGIELGSVNNTPSLGGVAFHVVAICQPLSWAGRLSPESGYICNVISQEAIPCTLSKCIASPFLGLLGKSQCQGGTAMNVMQVRIELRFYQKLCITRPAYRPYLTH